MRKLFFVIITTILITLSLCTAFGQTRSMKIRPKRQSRLALQRRCEQNLLYRSNAKEVWSGLEYQIFVEVAKAFKFKVLPHFYLVDEGKNAYYIIGSMGGKGRGKVLATSDLATSENTTPYAFKGIMAHEMAHLVLDPGFYCPDGVRRDIVAEQMADILAAKVIGFGPVRAYLLQGIKIPGLNTVELRERLRVLDEFEKLQKKAEQ